MDNISKHISYIEATRSDTAKRIGVLNIPNASELANMKLVAENIFEPIREHFKIPIFILSFFRAKAVNKKTKGASLTSEHCLGKAIDIDAQIYGGTTNKELFYYIKNNLEYNQLIWEFGNDAEPDWVHVSYSYPYNKKQVLKAIRKDEKTIYVPFSEPKKSK